MAIIFQNGFEEGDFSAYDSNHSSAGCTLEVEELHPYEGTHNLHWLSSGVAGVSGAAVRSFVPTDPCYFREYYKFNQINIVAGQACFLSYVNGVNGSSGPVIRNVGGTLYWSLGSYEGVVAQFDDTAIVVTTGVWYCIDNMRDVAGDNMKMWIDGTLRADVNRAITTDTDTVNTGCGFQTLDGVMEYYIDALVVADQYIGPAGMAWLGLTGNLTF